MDVLVTHRIDVRIFSDRGARDESNPLPPIPYPSYRGVASGCILTVLQLQDIPNAKKSSKENL